MAIIHQLDKRSGITYAYENQSYWDKEKKMSRANRKLIGRVDPLTGEIVPTDGRGRKTKEQKEESEKEELKKLCEKLQKRCASLEALVAALQNEAGDKTDKE